MSVEKFNNLKAKFLKLLPEPKNQIIESLNRCVLGLDNQTDLVFLTKFLGFDATGLNPHYAEELVQFLSAKTDSKIPTAAEHLGHSLEDTDSRLPEFKADDTDTLIEEVKPFKV